MKCVVCNRELKGSQKKYCGHSCSGYVKQENEKRRVIRNLLPPRPCAVCGGVFQPGCKINADLPIPEIENGRLGFTLKEKNAN